MERPDVRASDAERDTTVELLRDATVEGRLTLDELAARIGTASEATTRGELEHLTADLPVPAGAAHSRAPAVAPTVQMSVFGDVKRSGTWQLPERSQWRTVFGDVVLDLRAAEVTALEITIEAETVFGDIDLLVPEGVVVEIRSRTVFGDVRQNAGGTGPPGAPRIILEGTTIFGDVKVRAQRLREKLAQRLAGRTELP
jgi:hypothetical protein